MYVSVTFFFPDKGIETQSLQFTPLIYFRFETFNSTVVTLFLGHFYLTVRIIFLGIGGRMQNEHIAFLEM